MWHLGENIKLWGCSVISGRMKGILAFPLVNGIFVRSQRTRYYHFGTTLRHSHTNNFDQSAGLSNCSAATMHMHM